MTVTIIVMIIIGIVFIISSFFITEHFTNKEKSVNLDLLTIQDDYEFSERELQIIKNKIEDVIASQAKDILYETNDSLSAMANEKTIALGDYAVTVCDEIEKNHKEVMFLYSMLDDKQKEIMNTVKLVDGSKEEVKELLQKVKEDLDVVESSSPKTVKSNTENEIKPKDEKTDYPKNSALEQLEYLKKSKESIPLEDEEQQPIASSDDARDTDALDLDVDIAEEDLFSEIDHTDIDFDEVLEAEFSENENSNEIILEMYQNGTSILEIAKQLGLGVGEVRLVIDLYQGE